MPLTPEKRFTGREEEKRIFLEALTKSQAPDDHRLLTFYGVGGQGKSELSRYFQNLVRDHEGLNFNEWANKRGNLPEYYIAPLDFSFAESRDPAEALFKLRSALAGAKIDFFHFDLAFSYYLAKASPGVNMREKYSSLFDNEHSLFYDFILLGSLIPDPAIMSASVIIGTLGKYVQEHKSRQGDWYSSEGKKLEIQLKFLDQQKLLETLPSYLKLDLQAALASPDVSRLVFVLDTYEALWEDKPQQIGLGANAVDGWVRDLVSACSGVLFVFCGRNILEWNDFSKPHKRRNYTAMLKGNQHPLGGLSNADADLFLKKAGIGQPQIREAIIVSSAGLPFYLNLQLQTYEEIVEEGGTPNASDFGGHEHGVITNFLKHLNDHQEDALYVLAQARQFDKELFEQLKNTFCSGSPVSFNRFVKHSFVQKQQGTGQYVMHQLMREHLMDYLEREEHERYEEVHTFLFEYYDERAEVEDISAISPTQETSLVEAAYHKALTDTADFGMWLFGRTENFKQAARYRLLEPLFKQAITIVEDTDGVEHPNYSISLNNLAELMKRMGRYEEAEYFYRKAVDIEERLPSEGRPNRLSLFNNFANLLRLRGKDEAERRFYQARDEVKRNPDGTLSPTYLSLMNNFALLLEDKGEYEVAESLLHQVLEDSKLVHGKRSMRYVTALNNLANVLQKMNRNSEAKSLLLKVVVTLKRVVGEEHPTCAAALGNLALPLLALGQDEDAEKLLRTAIYIDREATDEGNEPPEYASHLSSLAELLRLEGRTEDAEPLYYEARDITEQKLGTEHPTYALRLIGLAKLMKSTNRNEDAKLLYKQAIKILLEKLGDEHPLTQGVVEDYRSSLENLK